MKKLMLSLVLVLCAFGSYAQFGTITFNQDTVVIIRRLKIMTLRPGLTTDSIIVHKSNGNIGGLAMNQFVVPWGNVTGKPTFATVATTGDYNDLLNKPSIPSAPTISTTTRSLNSNYTISTTKSANVAYSISLSVTNPLLAGNSTASVFLEYSTNAGSSWNTVSQAVNTSSVGVAVAVAIQNIQTSVISGVIPANALVRLRSTTSGTASVVFQSSQEVTY